MWASFRIIPKPSKQPITKRFKLKIRNKVELSKQNEEMELLAATTTKLSNFKK